MRNPVLYLRDLYARFERPISSISLIGGFVFDALTLRNVAAFWENFWVVIHLLIVAACIVLINRSGGNERDPADASKADFWYVNILQFFFGGLLSTFLVFYFRSATLVVSWPFLLILVLAFAANERLKRHYARLTFQISLFYLSLFSFAILIVPVVVHRIGPIVFLLSGVVSLLVLWLFILILRAVGRERFVRSRRLLFYAIGAIFVGVNLLYFTNIIPPIPLSLQDAGAYHSLVRTTSGNYIVSAEASHWYDFFSLYEDFHLPPGGSVYAYSAIFSPASLNTDIIYSWEHYDSAANRWTDGGSVTLHIVGGREEGYRSYAEKTSLAAGRWRVNVETPQGQVIGRILFNIIPVSAEPVTHEEIK